MPVDPPPTARYRVDGEELTRRLDERLCGRFRGLHVQLKDNGLVLTGRVPTYYAKQVAQELMMQFTDLPILANEIEVR